jgi:LAO/AO transport system kinase
VNKADREGAERLVAEIQSMLSLAAEGGHAPAIVETVAVDDRGTTELLAAVFDFRKRADASGLLVRKRRAQVRRQLEDTVRDRLLGHVWSQLVTADERERLVDRLLARELDPFAAADAVLRKAGVS